MHRAVQKFKPSDKVNHTVIIKLHEIKFYIDKRELLILFYEKICYSAENQLVVISFFRLS